MLLFKKKKKYFLNFPPTLPLSSSFYPPSPSLTSGSECLGNSEVVRYLYRILMSSCSSPLLQAQPHPQNYTFNLHNQTHCSSRKPNCVAVYSIFHCAASCVMHHELDVKTKCLLGCDYCSAVVVNEYSRARTFNLDNITQLVCLSSGGSFVSIY